jgi:hypothetical protein
MAHVRFVTLAVVIDSQRIQTRRRISALFQTFLKLRCDRVMITLCIAADGDIRRLRRHACRDYGDDREYHSNDLWPQCGVTSALVNT